MFQGSVIQIFSKFFTKVSLESKIHQKGHIQITGFSKKIKTIRDPLKKLHSNLEIFKKVSLKLEFFQRGPISIRGFSRKSNYNLGFLRGL
jgi:ferritin